MEKKITARYALKQHLRSIKLLHSVGPKYFPVETLCCLVTAVLPYATVFFSARILRELSGSRQADVLWKWVAIAVGVIGLLNVLKAFLYEREETLFNDLYGRKEILYARKMFSLDYADIDKQETQDLRAQIQENENWSGWGLMRTSRIYRELLQGIFGILSGIALTVTLFTQNVPETAGWLTVLNSPLFILALAAVLIGISILAGILESKVLDCWSGVAEQATFGNRLFGFFGFIGMKKDRACDVRMYRQEDLVGHYWDGNSAFGADGPIGNLAKGTMGLYSGLSQAIPAVLTGLIYVFVCLKAWGGAFGVGEITQYVGAVTALAVNVYGVWARVGEMKTNTVYLEKTYEFLDMPNAMYQGSLTTEKRADRQYEVEFKNVSFKYPGSEIWALKNVSLKFKVGRRLAIVGENGSGKTTFIKLLCRLYDPQEGQILLNGIDIRKYN